MAIDKFPFVICLYAERCCHP